MSKSKIKNIVKHTFKGFIDNFGVFLIPSYQRKYSWGPKHVTALWDSIKDNEPSYYIGTIVAIQDIDSGHILEIIDGQQRITTLSIFMLAIRDYMEKMGEEKIKGLKEKVEYFESFLIKSSVLAENEAPKVRLKFNKPALNKIHEGLINKNEEVCAYLTDKNEYRDLLDSQKNYIKNYKKCLQLIKEYAQSGKDINELINKIGTNISEVEFISIITESDTDTYEIFEALNSTSSPLTTPDLTKNAILKAVKNKSKKGDDSFLIKAETLWDELEGAFDNINIRWLDSFLRHQWISENGYITNSDLFKQIKVNKLSEDKTAESIITYLDKLVNDAKFYIGLRRADSNFLGKKFNNDCSKINIRKYRKNILEKLDLMSALGVTQVYEILLCLYKKFEFSSFYTAKQFEEDIERLWVFSFAAAYLSISPSKYEKDFANYSQKMNAYKGKNYNKESRLFFNILFKRVKSGKEEFVESLSGGLKYRESTRVKKLIRYTLHQFYQSKFSSDGKHTLKRPSLDHIFPKDNKAWGNLNLIDCINDIGNLCLLDSGDNGKLSNLLPSKKKDIYREDPFKYNSYITQYFDKFEESPTEEINRRTQEIAEVTFDHIIKKLG